MVGADDRDPGNAAAAVSYKIQKQTYSKCPATVTDLSSCACSKDNHPASIVRVLSSSVSFDCGSATSDDQASAQTVSKSHGPGAEPANRRFVKQLLVMHCILIECVLKQKLNGNISDSYGPCFVVYYGFSQG